MKNDYYFPRIDSFSFRVLHDEPIHDTLGEMLILFPEKPCDIILMRRVYRLSEGTALLALPFSYLRQKEESSCFFGYQLSFPKSFLRTLTPVQYRESAEDGIALAFPKRSALHLTELLSSLKDETLEPIYALPAIFSILEKESLPQTDISLETPLPKLVRRALLYIEETAPQKPDSAVLAERYGVSQSTLLRMFRTFVSTTPHKYAQALRVLHEKKNGVK